MSSFRNQQMPSENENCNRLSEISSNFRRRQFNDWKCLCPRRYVLAFMLFILLIIQAWRDVNVIYMLADALISEDENDKIKYSSIGDWTLKELDNYQTVALATEVFVQMPAALLIFIFSSHKFLLVAVSTSSFLHMLTPVALNHHSISLIFVLLSQGLIAAPVYIAVMTTWKDWAPPRERTRLMVFSLYGIFVGAAATTFYPFIFHYVTTDASFYLAGIAGIIWTLFWYCNISDIPQNDPLISEEELLYLENNIPSDYLQRIKVKDIPWKSILTSKPVLVLCLIFFKLACSIQTIVFSGTIFSFHLAEIYNPLYFFIPFGLSFCVVLQLCAVLVDWLIGKFSGKALVIRKAFLCGGFLLQCITMIGTLTDSEYTTTIFYMISYSVFAASVPGFITIPMDISPRYVSVIAGIIFTFYSLGFVCIPYFIAATISFLHLKSISWLFLFDGSVSLLSIIFFLLWGDVEEQLWSLTFTTQRRTNDYKSYPKPEEEDEINLVT